MCDGQEVFHQFLLGTVSGRVCLVKNDEPGIRTGNDPLYKVDTESGEPVFVGNHNFCDQSLTEVFQKPFEPFPLVVKARGNVAVDLVLWILGFKPLDLPFEVVLLFMAGHTAIDGSCGNNRVFFLFWDGCVSSLCSPTHKFFDVKSSLPTGHSDVRNKFFVGPGSKCFS